MKITYSIFLFLFAISSHGQTAKEYLNSGNIKYDIRDFQGAIEDYSKAIEKNLKFAEAYFKRGSARQRLGFSGSPDEALKWEMEIMSDFSKAIENDPNDPFYFAARAQVKESGLEDYIGALNDYSKSIELSLKDTISKKYIGGKYWERGRLKMKMIDFIGALEDFNTGIDLSPPNTEYNKSTLGHLYFERGILKQKMGDTKSACIDWSRSGEFGRSEAYKKIKEFCNK
jgi:tetratricopeptide (TPR) repeat protein